MATPTTGSVGLVGGSGGQAPHPLTVYADIEGSGSTWATGSGGWAEGRWAFQLIDASDDTIYDSGLMDLSCPNSSVTATAYNRYGSAPVAGCVIYDPGDYYWRVKYQNRDGDWSDWVNSSTVTVAANTRTKIYCGYSGASDSNNGLSQGASKATLNGALSAVSGNDYEIILADDATIDSGTFASLTSRSGIWIHRDGTGTNRPVITLTDRAINFGDDSVFDGINFAYDGVALNRLFDVGNNKTNCAFCNVEFDEAQSLFEFASGTNFDGIVIYNIKQNAETNRYCFFANGGQRVNILGCDWQLGSTTEHILRVMQSSGTTKFYSIDFSQLSLNNSVAKNTLRLNARRFIGLYRCTATEGVSASQDNDDVDDVRFDCVRVFITQSPPFYLANFGAQASKSNFHLASCVFYKIGLTSNNAIKIHGDLTNCSVKNCLVFNGGLSRAPLEIGFSATASGPVVVTGSLIVSDAASHSGDGGLIDLVTGDESLIEIRDCVFYEHPTHTLRALRVVEPDPDEEYTVAELNGLSIGSGNVSGGVTVSTSVASPGGSTVWQDNATDITGVFESINGVVLDRSRSTWDAGPWARAETGSGESAGYLPSTSTNTINFGGRGAASSLIIFGG